LKGKKKAEAPVYEYKFYRALVTGGGYVPQGDCQATLTLDKDRNPTWTDISDDFRDICLPWFGNSVVMGVLHDNPEPFKPYSREALDHLSKHQLPSQGFMMMTIKSGPSGEPEEQTRREPEPKKETTGSPIPGFAPQQFFLRPTITHNKLKSPKKKDDTSDEN
jgi:hypothetical protein